MWQIMTKRRLNSKIIKTIIKIFIWGSKRFKAKVTKYSAQLFGLREKVIKKQN